MRAAGSSWRPSVVVEFDSRLESTRFILFIHYTFRVMLLTVNPRDQSPFSFVLGFKIQKSFNEMHRCKRDIRYICCPCLSNFSHTTRKIRMESLVVCYYIAYSNCVAMLKHRFRILNQALGYEIQLYDNCIRVVSAVASRPAATVNIAQKKSGTNIDCQISPLNVHVV